MKVIGRGRRGQERGEERRALEEIDWFVRWRVEDFV